MGGLLHEVVAHCTSLRRPPPHPPWQLLTENLMEAPLRAGSSSVALSPGPRDMMSPTAKKGLPPRGVVTQPLGGHAYVGPSCIPCVCWLCVLAVCVGCLCWLSVLAVCVTVTTAPGVLVGAVVGLLVYLLSCANYRIETYAFMHCVVQPSHGVRYKVAQGLFNIVSHGTGPAPSGAWSVAESTGSGVDAAGAMTSPMYGHLFSGARTRTLTHIHPSSSVCCSCGHCFHRSC